MIVALFAAAALETAPAIVPPTCREAQAAIRALDDSRPQGAAPLRLQIVCEDGKAVRVRDPVLPQPPRTERTPNLYRVPERCKDSPYKVVDRYGRPVSQKLADLPKGALLLAIARDIDGCPVLTVARGNPGEDDPNPPTPGRVTPADVQPAAIPPKRGAAPSPKP